MHSIPSPPPPSGLCPPQSVDAPFVDFPGSQAYRLGKRVLDFAIALVLLILLLPLMLFAMALVKLTSRGPAVYSQVRMGRDGIPFVIYKIRTMRQDAERLTGASWSRPGDSRITPVGRWLRATHLDELPQLWNVVIGDMSLVGPRPERPEFLPQLEQAVPRYRDRLLVLPGVTGLAQVQLPPDTDLDSVRLKMAYDFEYVYSINLWLDLRICWATAFKVAHFKFETISRIFRFRDKEAIIADYRRIAGDPPRRAEPKREPKIAAAIYDTIGSEKPGEALANG
jgi:lipopolysaccharide/colanic/teichoic acid biosynthesis glycosyltransferase